MKIIETGPREIGFVLWGHCQNLLDDPRKSDRFPIIIEQNTTYTEDHNPSGN